MKKSYYNFIFKGEKGNYLAFNSRTAALAKIDDDFFNILDAIENIKYEELDEKQKELINNMKENGYIVEDCYNELNEIQYRNMQGRFNQGILTLIIAPTLNCNFKCTYCYESSKNTKMSIETQEMLVKFVNRYTDKIKELKVVWYGGEPLLYKNIISNLSDRLINSCNKNSINYSAYIITNGYLVDDETIEILKRCRVFGAQLTLDGPPHIHNKRRILKSGKEDNFKKVFNSIIQLKTNDIDVSVRINIDRDNIEHIDELLKIFKENSMKDIFVYFGQVVPFTESCKSISSSCYSNKEFSNTIINLQKKLIQNGFSSGIDSCYYPSLKTNYCSADQINSFVIDPSGYLYKCMNEIGNVELAVGNINENMEEGSRQYNRLLEYMLYSPIDIEECRTCKLLPVCMGGCPSLKKDNNNNGCERWKYNLKNIIEYTYNCYEEYTEEFKKAFEYL